MTSALPPTVAEAWRLLRAPIPSVPRLGHILLRRLAISHDCLELVDGEAALASVNGSIAEIVAEYGL